MNAYWTMMGLLTVVAIGMLIYALWPEKKAEEK